MTRRAVAAAWRSAWMEAERLALYAEVAFIERRFGEDWAAALERDWPRLQAETATIAEASDDIRTRRADVSAAILHARRVDAALAADLEETTP